MKGKVWAVIAAISVVFIASCGGGGGDGGGGGIASGSTPGTLSVNLMDAAVTDFQVLYVSVQEVAVHRDGGGDWDVISLPNKTYNLLDLVNGVREKLALATLPSGHYTQMRLILSDKPDDSLNILSQKHPFANYFIDQGGQSHELKVPSGLQTGIKIVQGFDVSANQTTELLLDFDVSKSVVEPGNSGKWLLKPTIKIMNTTDACIIEGDASGAGVLVSAQVYDASVQSIEDVVTVKAATVSDASGHYKIFVEPGTYTVVGYKDGYAPVYRNTKLIATAGNIYTVNFALAASTSGTATGGVTITGADQEQYATVSIRKNATVGGNVEQIEVKSVNVANGGTFSTGLPVGSYTAVISTYGKTTVSQSFTVSSNTTVSVGDITF